MTSLSGIAIYAFLVKELRPAEIKIVYGEVGTPT